jgi:glycerate kinase
MYFLIAPDKFKGSIDSISLCTLLRKEIFLLDPSATINTFPLADGGDGFAQIIHHYFGTDPVFAATVDPFGRPIEAKYQYSPISQTAFIEMASASGLALLSHEERDVMKASSFGTGLLIKDAIEKGAKKIILGIGGSATNDGGTGMAAALGYMFLTEGGFIIHPSGEMLSTIHSILPPENKLLQEVEFTVACDVKNPLYGPTGAAFVYSPQKGASPEQVIVLDEGLKHLDSIFQQNFNQSVANMPGAGAAGGMGAGCMVFLNARLIPGIDYVIESIDLENEIAKADIIITGEGGFDMQSLHGKVVGHIADLARKHDKKIHVICGECLLEESHLSELGIAGVSSLVSFAATKEEAITSPENFIPTAVKSLLQNIRK